MDIINNNTMETILKYTKKVGIIILLMFTLASFWLFFIYSIITLDYTYMNDWSDRVEEVAGQIKTK